MESTQVEQGALVDGHEGGLSKLHLMFIWDVRTVHYYCIQLDRQSASR